MRARSVNESIENPSIEEVIQFAKDEAVKNPRKILGPATNQVYNKPGQYYVEKGGVSREYRPDQLDELIHAIEVVNDVEENVTWSLSPGNKEWNSSPRIGFSSDAERRTGEAISKYYRDKPSGGFTGD